MTEILRARDIAIIPHLAQHLVFSNDRVKEFFLLDLAKSMTNTPESIFVVVAFDGETLVGFSVAHHIAPGYPYVWISQAWSEKSNSWDVADEMFMRLLMWVVSLGVPSIRAETGRAKQMFRRFGFRPVEQIIEYDLDQAMVDRFLTKGRDIFKWETHSAANTEAGSPQLATPTEEAIAVSTPQPVNGSTLSPELAQLLLSLRPRPEASAH